MRRSRRDAAAESQRIVRIAGKVKGIQYDPVVLATDASVVPCGRCPGGCTSGSSWHMIATAFVATSGDYAAAVEPTPPDVTGRNDVLIAELRAIAQGVQMLWRRSQHGQAVLVLCDNLEAVQWANQWLHGVFMLPAGYETWRATGELSTLEWLYHTFAAFPHLYQVEHVHGHTGHPLNEGANDLARLAGRTARGEVTRDNANSTTEMWVPAMLAGMLEAS